MDKYSSCMYNYCNSDTEYIKTLYLRRYMHVYRRLCNVMSSCIHVTLCVFYIQCTCTLYMYMYMHMSTHTHTLMRQYLMNSREEVTMRKRTMVIT